MTEQKTNQQVLNEAQESLEQMLQNREKKRQELKEQIKENDGKVQKLRDSAEVKESIGDDKGAQKERKQIQDLQSQRKDLSDRLQMVSDDDGTQGGRGRFFEKLQAGDGLHKEHAQQADQAGVAILQELAGSIESLQSELEEISRTYQMKVNALRDTAKQAFDVVHTLNFCRKFLSREERIPAKDAKFRPQIVKDNWSLDAGFDIQGPDLKDRITNP